MTREELRNMINNLPMSNIGKRIVNAQIDYMSKTLEFSTAEKHYTVTQKNNNYQIAEEARQ